jgi:glycosyltransferase involved in cell wall biosynthesis
MRILVVNTCIFPVPLTNYGGLEAIAWWCAKGLAERGHDVSMIAAQGSICPGVNVIEALPPGHGDERAAYGGCTYRNANGEDVQWSGYWQKLIEMESAGGGVCIDHSWNKYSALLRMEGRIPRVPILAVLHAPVNTMINSVPPEGVASFICISDDQKQNFEALFSPRKARRCYNGIDLDFYKPLDVPRSNRLLFLARFSTIKGASIALEVCREADVEIDLIGDRQITGEPAYYNYCCSLADGVKRKVIDGVGRGQTVWWYSQAKAFLHPNKYFREPLGLAPLEAQACGLPVCAWSLGAMTETINHGETGFLVNSEKEMLEVVKTDALSGLNRNRCREWASQWSIEKMVDAYEQRCIEAMDKPW